MLFDMLNAYLREILYVIKFFVTTGNIVIKNSGKKLFNDGN